MHQLKLKRRGKGKVKQGDIAAWMPGTLQHFALPPAEQANQYRNLFAVALVSGDKGAEKNKEVAEGRGGEGGM